MPKCPKCGIEDTKAFSESRNGKSNYFVQPLCKGCTKPKQALYRSNYKAEKIKENHLAQVEAGQTFLFGAA